MITMPDPDIFGQGTRLHISGNHGMVLQPPPVVRPVPTPLYTIAASGALACEDKSWIAWTCAWTELHVPASGVERGNSARASRLWKPHPSCMPMHLLRAGAIIRPTGSFSCMLWARRAIRFSLWISSSYPSPLSTGPPLSHRS